ncbi:MAG: ADP-ribosylglycohydrolase family protein [Clostridia bacterium]|nr:ADP-ribosylglycohydrolase family protein [Clostridia bacterium]
MKNIWRSGILGVLVGDALGCPVQFESREKVATHPVTGMRGYGTFNLPAGSWTDDSSLTLALLESIRRRGEIDLKDIMDNFVRWLEDGAFTPFGYSYDIGRGTMDAIRRYMREGNPLQAGGTDARNNGNGSLMRIMPAVLYCLEKALPDGEAVETVHRVGRLTHGHLRAGIACGLYFFMARAVLGEAGTLAERLQAGLDRGFAFYEEALSDGAELRYYSRLRDLGAFAATPADGIRGSGYVVETLEAVVWSLLNEESFEGTLLRAVNLGEDTDTVGAIAGGLAGLYYGDEAIPVPWVEILQRRDWIEAMIDGGETSENAE